MLKYTMIVDILTATEQMMIDKFISLSTKAMDIESIYLFGSRAKAEGHIESDIDVAVIIKNKKTLKEITRRVIELSIKVGEELDVSGKLMLSPIVINESLLKTNIGIGKTIREEGVLLWLRKSAGRKRKAT